MRYFLWLLWAALIVVPAVAAAPAGDWTLADWVIKDSVGDVADGSLDLCNVFLREDAGAFMMKLTTRSALAWYSGIKIDLLDTQGGLLSLDPTDPDPAVNWRIYRGV